jgi:hypothetical protein
METAGTWGLAPTWIAAAKTWLTPNWIHVSTAGEGACGKTNEEGSFMWTGTGNLAPPGFQGHWEWPPSRYTTIQSVIVATAPTDISSPHLFSRSSISSRGGQLELFILPLPRKIGIIDKHRPSRKICTVYYCTKTLVSVYYCTKTFLSIYLSQTKLRTNQCNIQSVSRKLK